jgi:hypothetical protein
VVGGGGERGGKGGGPTEGQRLCFTYRYSVVLGSGIPLAYRRTG